MEWEQIIEKTAKTTGFEVKEMENVLNAFFDTVIDGMKTEETVALRGDFGRFLVRESGGEARSEQRPQILKRQRTAVFKTSNALQKWLRQSDEDYITMLEDMDAVKQKEQIETRIRQMEQA